MAKYVSQHAAKRAAKGKRNKTAVAVIAVVLALGVIFGGTFAWQSISQEALNEVTGTVNPGGRLHDDFTLIYEADGETPKLTDEGTLQYDKNVYVENFTSLASNGVQIFARVRLDEYMEIGKNAGTLNADETAPAENNEAVSLVPGAVLEDKSTWTPHVWGQDDDFHTYWTWDQEGGSAIYMPTFNKNKDSLEADINGTFDAQFEDHNEYAEGDTRDANAIYDADTAPNDEKETDEVANGGWDVNDIIDGTETLPETYKPYVTLEEETHTAKATLDATIISMDEYMELLNNGDPDDDMGNFWVYDTDGWAYWAGPIDPDTATGLLLDGIARTETIINEDWYYGINVVAQFITGDDLGQDDASGFYDPTEGLPPSEKALLLLNAIGVDVTFEIKSDEDTTAEEALAKAMKYGGTIKLMEDVEVTDQLVVSADTVLEIGEYSIKNTDADIYSTATGTWSLISVQDGATLTINGGNFITKENDSFCVDVRDGSTVIINDGTFSGNISAVYVYEGEAIINGGTYSIQQTANKANPYDELLNCYDTNYKNGTAKISVFGGSFENFDPANSNDGSYVPRGYASSTEDDVTYTVVRSSVSETETETAGQ